MIFKSITITNLFSYYGENVFDLSTSPEVGKNIVVLMGRNGGGKTSFINSVKLLFLGPAEEIRRTVQRRRTPTEKLYICGIDNEWAGILNVKAKNNNINNCGIKISWESGDGAVIAERTWTINVNNNTYKEQLTVSTAYKGDLQGESAKNYLEQCLPKAYVPYFFFDGEEVQSLAEANSNEIIQTMERLLNIRPLENLQEQLRLLRREWEKASMDKEKERQLIEAEAELNGKNAKKEQLNQQISDTEVNIAESQEDLEKIQRNLHLLWAIPSQTSEVRLEEKKKQKVERQKEILSNLADGWHRDSFLRVLPELVEKSLKAAETITQNNIGTHAEFLASLKQRLPAIFTSPPFPSPRLEQSQVAFYQKRIQKELEVFSVEDKHNSLLDIDGYRAITLSRVLTTYRPSLKPALQIQEKLSEAKSINNEIFEIEKQLHDTGTLSQRQQEEYSRLQDQEKETKDGLMNLQLQLNLALRESKLNDREITTCINKIKDIEKALEIAQDHRLQYDFAKSLINILEEVKKRLKVQKRQELEDTYNRYLKRLLDSNTLINHIEIDDHFAIAYKDNNGEKIGLSTISAGMKQLSATALLWALKDVSGKDIPIIIDTPMGRIDRQHQDNLLREYYPNVGKQMILLPTDSELDDRKHAMLKPHICREYTLDNPDGQETKVESLNA